VYKKIMAKTDHRISPMPEGPWLMSQRWDHLLFLHYPVSKEFLRINVPEQLELDTFDGNAWITIIPFEVYGMHLRYGPKIPYLHRYRELNVRTYVRRNGIHGIYFFSLDADKLLAVYGGRMATLPYYHAKIKMNSKEGSFSFSSMRRNHCQVQFSANYRPSSELFRPAVNSLSFWLLERYYLWTLKENKLFHLGIHHTPWEVSVPKVEIERNSLVPFLANHDLTTPAIVHYARSKRVLFWALKKEK
jgi:uncharacterized protein